MGQKKYPDELRERATRMALEALADPARAKGAIRRIGEELGVHPEALRTWVKKAQVDGGLRPGTTTDEAQRIKELEKEVRELRRANAILKSASACLSRRSVSARLVDLPVHRLPQEGVRGRADLQGAQWRRSQDRPEFLTHARRSRPPSARSLRDETLKAEISKVHKNQLLGSGGPQDAHDAGPTRNCRASRCRSRGPVHRRTPHGRPGPTRRQVRQVPAHHAQRAARAVPGRPGQAPLRGVCSGWAVGHRHSPASGRCPSYVRTFSGWVYVVFVTDVFSRRIIGWQTTYRPVCTDLALDALEMAVWQRKRQGADLSDLVHHLRPRRVSTGPSAMGQALSECEAVASVGSKGDSFRLCSGRGSELLVQGRADPQPGPLGGHRRRRGRHRRVGALGGHHSLSLRHRYANPSRARSHLGTRPPPPRTITTGNHRHQINQPPQNPGLDSWPGLPAPRRGCRGPRP